MAPGPRHPTTTGGNRSEALARARAAVNGRHPQEAQRIAEQILQTEPRQLQALHVLGCALLMQGRAGDAIAPLEASARGCHDPEVETQLAIALLQLGRNDDALARLARAVKRQPPYPAAFHTLGHLLASMQRPDEAIATLRRGVEIAPMMPEMSVQLGYAFMQRRHYSEAKAAFGRALSIAPDFPDALIGIAKAHYESGENAAAADCMRRYLRHRPHEHAAWIQLGHCLLALGEREAGYACFRTASRGERARLGDAVNSLAASRRGRAWLRPSAAERYLRGENKT